MNAPTQALLTKPELDRAGALLPGWQVAENQLQVEYLFSSFVEAFAFLVRVALEAERHQHHPEIWNSYNRVRLTLSSHDAGGVTARDTELAQIFQALID